MEKPRRRIANVSRAMDRVLMINTNVSKVMIEPTELITLGVVSVMIGPDEFVVLSARGKACTKDLSTQRRMGRAGNWNKPQIMPERPAEDRSHE
jgi:hypothetical protein